MSELLTRIEAELARIGPVVIACSGGIDSTLLAVVAHRRDPAATLVAHAVSPAVPQDCSERVREVANREGWNLHVVRSGEFEDEAYLSNPVNRCYFCKSNLYSGLEAVSRELGNLATICSGANHDDLGEYRPGLIAAAEKGVEHPWIRAGFAKREIRALARELELPFAELPASPCLASRLYTGTRVTAPRLRAIGDCEDLIRRTTGIAVVRCRINDDSMLVEVLAADRDRIDSALLVKVGELAGAIEPSIRGASLDAGEYRPGRAFVGAS